MCWTCDEYDNKHKRERKDFQHTKAGPEEMPHRKKGGKPKKKRSDHKHLWETNGWRKVISFSYNGRMSWYWKKSYECLVCEKKGNTLYSWNKVHPDSL